MRRYDDMEDLLRRVRERLAINLPEQEPQRQDARPDESYTALLNQSILLYHEAEQLRGLLGSSHWAMLDKGEREELRGLVGKAVAAAEECDQLLR